MSRRRAMAFYSQQSTANPTGWRPWNSRLSFYTPNTFPVPTTGSGRFLLQPGASGGPSAAGGLGNVEMPHFPNFKGPRTFYLRDNPSAPRPVYSPPASVRASLSGMGLVPPTMQRQWNRPSSPVIVNGPFTANGAAGATPGSIPSNRWQRRQQMEQQQQQQQQNSGIDSTNQYWQQQQAQPAMSTATDASGNPLYATPPAGMVITGYDAQGNPVYGQATTAATAPAAAAPASTSFFSEDSLGLGFNNGIYLAVGLGLVLILKKK